MALLFLLYTVVIIYQSKLTLSACGQYYSQCKQTPQNGESAIKMKREKWKEEFRRQRPCNSAERFRSK